MGLCSRLPLCSDGSVKVGATLILRAIDFGGTGCPGQSLAALLCILTSSMGAGVGLDVSLPPRLVAARLWAPQECVAVLLRGGLPRELVVDTGDGLLCWGAAGAIPGSNPLVFNHRAPLGCLPTGSP